MSTVSFKLFFMRTGFCRNCFKEKQKGLTWNKLFQQNLFVNSKKQSLWYLMVLMPSKSSIQNQVQEVSLGM